MQAKDNCKIRYSTHWAMGKLDVDPSADEETIKNAWRIKSRKAHPDRLLRLLYSLGLHSLDQSHKVQLAYDIDADIQVAIAADGGIAPLVQLAIDGAPEAKRNAACALANLAAHQFCDVQLAYEILQLKKYWLAEKERKKQWWVCEPEDEDDPNNHEWYVRVEKTVVDGEIKWLPSRMHGPPIPENPETSNADLKDYELKQYTTNWLTGERTTVVKFLNTFSKDGKKAFTYRYGMWHATERIEEATHLVVQCCPAELTLKAYAKSSTFTCDEENGNLLSFGCTPVEELNTKYLDLNSIAGVVLLPLCYAEQQDWNGHEFVTIGYALRLLMTELSLHKQYACAEEYPSLRRMQEAFVRITQEFLANPNPDVLGKRKCRHEEESEDL